MRRAKSSSLLVMFLKFLFAPKKENVQRRNGRTKSIGKNHSQIPVIDLSEEERSSWNLKLLMRLDWYLFEELTCQLFRLLDYKAELTKQGADGGIDVLLFQPGEYKPHTAIQCKSWTNRTVGVKEIRELLGSMVHGGFKDGIFVTTNVFTDEARRFAFDSKIGLMDGPFFIETLQSLEGGYQKELLESTLKDDCFMPTCPSCGTKMILRTAKKGNTVGKQFYGCRSYPKCRTLFQIARPPKIEKLMAAEKPWLHPDDKYIPSIT